VALNYRLDEILTKARERGKVSAEELADGFGVTVQTVRRDLNTLCEQGLLTRVYGGAILPSGTRNIGYEDRRRLHEAEKERIGQACARRIPNGASVFLDIGTTAEAVARALLKHEGLMVVTNNINVANILATNADAEILLAGGILRRADGGLVGEVTADFVRQFKVDTAVIGASAIDEAGDALDFDFREVRVAQTVLSGARRAFLVADASKLSRTAPVRLAALSAFDTWFTDAAPGDGLARRCAEAGTEIAIA
jgi:DeoR family glycerol-3-phosphate regulon repressor